MSNVGFKGFAKPKTLGADIAAAQLGNVSADEYVIFTGNQYGRRRSSGRSACLSTIKEKLTPIAMATYVKRCQSIDGGKGFDTSISVGGLTLHQVAKPTVYFLTVKDKDGNYRAKKDIPNPDRALFDKPIKAGDIVMGPKHKLVAVKAVASKKEETKQIEAKK